jgi:hypothetical protein
LLKLDIQGAEKAALVGARSVLKSTHAVICEADIDDFQGINAVLADSGFVLYDLTGLNRLPDEVGFIPSTLIANWKVCAHVRSGMKNTMMPSSMLRSRDGKQF